MSSIETLLLDLRYFLDESISFIEFFEYGERDLTRRFWTSAGEVYNIRQWANEYIRYIYDIKKLLFTYKYNSDLNPPGLKFSDQFKNKRVFYYTCFFRRLEELDERILGETALSNDMVKLYFRTIQNLVRGTNNLISYLESARWSRGTAQESMENLVKLCNDFLCLFEKFVRRLEENKRVLLDKNVEGLESGSSTGSEVDSDNENEEIVKEKVFSFIKGIPIWNLVVAFIFIVLFIWLLSKKFEIADDREKSWYFGSGKRGIGCVGSIGFMPGLLTAHGWGKWMGETWLMSSRVEVNSYQMWCEVFGCMSQIYVVILSMGVYVLVEWLIR